MLPVGVRFLNESFLKKRRKTGLYAEDDVESKDNTTELTVR